MLLPSFRGRAIVVATVLVGAGGLVDWLGVKELALRRETKLEKFGDAMWLNA